MNIKDAMKKSQYYLHESGKIIFKPLGGVDKKSDFVIEVWSGDKVGNSPVDFTYFLKEAKKLGAEDSEIYRLAENNDLDSFMSDWRGIVFGGS
ncbi:hypothetical protein ACP6H1_21625 [Vibrio harveyi]|uniref:hypothetical protein n=1 Tax=Vibrio harveyi TaxID=669 RepID=UPI003CF60BE8